MTEQEWLACIDIEPMVEFLRDRASDRKLRLFAVACCRRIWHLLTDPRSRHAVEVAERLADGRATEEERLAAYEGAFGAVFEGPAPRAFREAPAAVGNAVINVPALDAAVYSSWIAARTPSDCPRVPDQAERSAQFRLLGDILGPADRPRAADPRWLTWNHGTVPAVARHIDGDRAYYDLPILADALEDAGCSDRDILSHCRSGGEHVHGCWVVDLLLGKA
jgi:hypothetical protein